ncbi:unnamed protein product, partial [Allacma fusca]
MKSYVPRFGGTIEDNSSDSDSEIHFPMKSNCTVNLPKIMVTNNEATEFKPESIDFSDSLIKLFTTPTIPYSSPNSIPDSQTPRRSSRKPRPPKRLLFNIGLHNLYVCSSQQMELPSFEMDLESPIYSPIPSDDEANILNSPSPSPDPITDAMSKMEIKTPDVAAKSQQGHLKLAEITVKQKPTLQPPNHQIPALMSLTIDPSTLTPKLSSRNNFKRRSRFSRPPRFGNPFLSHRKVWSPSPKCLNTCILCNGTGLLDFSIPPPPTPRGGS